MNNYESAKAAYEALGIDVEGALSTLAAKPISIHCWQGDDVGGFEAGAGQLSGGIQATGSYPGKACNPQQLMADFSKAISLIPGQKRINLHASYAVTGGQAVGRDELEPRHFQAWVDYAREKGIGIDFNPTFFSHAMVKDNLTLSSPDEAVRGYWVRHGIACRRIASWIAGQLGSDVLCNVWIPDGFKDVPGDRMGPRARLKKSLDEIFAEKLPGVIDCVESKVFGIGLESCTVGSSEFYMAYASQKPGVYVLMDNGHYHPTEMVSEKLSSMMLFFDKVPLHVTRPVRWDSDHVVLLDDETKEIAKELVRGGLDKALIGLDFFDASINRVAAWVVGTRNMQKALLWGLLMPHEKMRRLQDETRFTELMVLSEELKSYPFGDIWAHYCQQQGVPAGGEWLDEVKQYEQEVLLKR